MSSLNDSDVELRRFTSINSQHTINSNGSSWNGDQQKFGNNPSYLSFDSERGGARGPDVMDPTSSDRMYDVVPGDKHGAPPPPLPEARKTTPNTMYATRGETLHPNTTLEKNMTAAYSQDGIEADIDHMSSKCLRVTCLSILVVASLFLAIVAVVLVLLLWFGVYVPQATTAATSCSGSNSAGQGLTGGSLSSSLFSSTPLPTPTSSSACLCPTPDLLPIIARIENETANLTGLINSLDDEITLYKMQSNATDQSLLGQSNYISSQVSEINSTCHETLVNLTSQNVSLAGVEFDAELRNVGLYSNCIYEYLSNCTIGQSDTNCSTSYHSVLADGYFNLDVACHVDLAPITGQPVGVFYAPLTNLRTEAQDGQSIDYGTDTAQQILAKSQMRCECSLVALVDGFSRSNVVTCYLFRSRCPIMNTFQNVVVVTPP